MSDLTLNISNLSKKYKLYEKPIDRLKEAFHPFKKKYHQDFYALRNISFTSHRGDIIGIIGKNGSGKSTLLQIITGVLTPTNGTVDVYGRISALLELGAGFNPELTGMENVYFQSSILGYSHQQTTAMIDDILAFAEIGDFIHQPVKSYSSGMFVRLAFAVAITVDPEILIVDEALAVGDFRFRQKCIRTMREIMEKNKTILFVSHDTGSVTEFCNKVIWLRDGEIYASGNPHDICKEYISYMSYGLLTDSKETDSQGADTDKGQDKGLSYPSSVLWQDVSQLESFGERGAEISRVVLFGAEDARTIRQFEGGERVVFAVEVVARQDVDRPIVGFHLMDPNGVRVLGFNTFTYSVAMDSLKKGDVRVVEFEFDFPYLKAAKYSFSPAMAEGSHMENIQHHWVYDAYMIEIVTADDSARLGHYLVLKDNVDIRMC